MSYDITSYITALNTAKTHFQQSVKGVDVRDAIVDQCDKTMDLGVAINDNLNDAITQSFAVPDTSLTQQGKPAEAKATGDALALKADNGDCTVDSLTVGMRAGTTGQNSVVIGAGKATANSSVALGGEATGAAAVAVGAQTKASSDYQFVCGKYNVEDGNSDNLFIVGNGTGSSARADAFVVRADGNAWVNGTIKVGGTGYSDSNAKELATKNYVDSGLNAKQAKLVVGTNLDNAPSQSSTHPITAKGVYDALRKTVTFNMRTGVGLDERINKAYRLGDMVFLSLTIKTSGAFAQSDFVLGSFSGIELLPGFDTVFINCFTCADLNARTPHPATAVIANNSGTLQLKLTATETTDTIVQINASFAVKP